MKRPAFNFKFTSVNAINVVGSIIVLYLLVVLAQTVKRNYDLGRQIDDLKGQVTTLQDQKDELAYNIQYYNTDSFRDREARSKLGLQLPGENVVIVPHDTPAPTAATTTKPPAKARTNFQQWLDFLAGRG
jgi:cell division protein FtsB